ncbi:MAG: DNA polymerase I [Flaviflexus sp.]|nr:DNA polymerase I [Flaviflexus sp.]
MNDRLLLLDGHSLAFRSFFAIPAENFHTAQGQYTNAIHGFLSTLIKLYSEEHPTHVAVAFDLPGGTFRTREYAEYKAGRAETPAEFQGQIGLIKEALDALGIAWVTKDQIEADDIIATLATRGRDAGMEVVISSGDKDAYQLVGEGVTLLYPIPRGEMRRMDEAGVVKQTGVTPTQYPDMSALVGEKADNLPGVPKVGPKTAKKWIDAYGDLDGILSHADEITGKVGESLREHADLARRNRKLNELLRNADLDVELADLVPGGLDREAVHQLFDTLEFNRLRDRVFSVFRADGEEDNTPNIDLEAVEIGPGELADFLSKHGSEPLGIIPGSPLGLGGSAAAAYLTDPNKEDLEALTSWLADKEHPKVVHGAKDAVRELARRFEAKVEGITCDTELAAYLLHPDQRDYELGDLVSRYTSMSLPQVEEGTLDLDLGGGGQGDAAGLRAAALVPLSQALMKELRERDEMELLTGLEMPLTRILRDMEDRGIAVDQQVFNSLFDNFDARVNHAAERAWEAAGYEMNLSSPKALQKVLFEDMGLPKTRATKTGYTTNAEALTDLAAKLAGREDAEAERGLEFLGQLLEHRDAIKLRQSVEGLRKAIGADGRIHTTFQQTVAGTGRLSSTNPNLQNIHARTEEGLKIREAFVPGEGFTSLLTADYSQIEMRLMAHQSGDAALIQAFIDGEDLHSYVASHVYGISPDEVTSAQRSKIKAMSYGLAYGLSAFGLSRQLRIDQREAQSLMDDYFQRFGAVRDYLDSVVAQARKDGYTSTLLGRRRYLPDLYASNHQRRQAAERMALNAPIQGSAADIIKIAMLRTEEALASGGFASQMLLQVHDELVLEVADGEEEAVTELVETQMGEAVELSVPLSVSVGIGPNWRAAAH